MSSANTPYIVVESLYCSLTLSIEYRPASGRLAIKTSNNSYIGMTKSTFDIVTAFICGKDEHSRMEIHAVPFTKLVATKLYGCVDLSTIYEGNRCYTAIVRLTRADVVALKNAMTSILSSYETLHQRYIEKSMRSKDDGDVTKTPEVTTTTEIPTIDKKCAKTRRVPLTTITKRAKKDYAPRTLLDEFSKFPEIDASDIISTLDL